MTTKKQGIALNQMSIKERVTELLDHPRKYADIMRNNLNFFFPIIEKEAREWQSIYDRSYGDMDEKEVAKDPFAQEIKADIKGWNDLARRCCLEVLKIEPDPSKRTLWAISSLVGEVDSFDPKTKTWKRKCQMVFGGYEKLKDGGYLRIDVERWVTNIGDKFLTKEEAEGYMNWQCGFKLSLCKERGLPPSCKVVPIPPWTKEKK